MELKSREQKVRRGLDRIGYRLIKSRKQSIHSDNCYWVVDVKHGASIWSDGAYLEEIEDWLKEG
ncbi:MAG TPA: hypothetical protein PKY31_16470 [Spirochaetota bacterium]|nr:hypothetical protein [Spirochaetota bacterium]